MSTAYDVFSRRFGFSLPTVYRSMNDAGLLDSNNPAHLQLTDFHWLSLDQILANNAVPVVGGRLVPFAESGRGDRWCWNTAWNSEQGIAVVFVARGRRVAEGYAASFAATVYRKLLEEFSASWLLGTFVHSTRELEQRFRRYAQDVAAYLPPSWAATLAQLSARPVLELSPGVSGTLRPDEASSIIQRDLAFAHLGRTIKLRT
jgi:hypothetical protein